MCSRGVGARVECVRPAHFVHDVCQALETFATANSLDPGFFARLIWQESRFDPNAVSPARAMGIAQFIASTAKQEGLRDPFNPAEALEHSALLLGRLTRMFGNVGLAAAAYNSGESRTGDFVNTDRILPRETRNYVQIITGLTADTWRDAPPETHDFSLQKDKPFQQACHELARNRRLTAYPEPEPALRKFGVQLAYGTTRANALAQYRQRARSCAGLLKGEEPDLIWQKSRASPRGGYYMVRIGRDDNKEAWRFCNRLKQSGCICAVYRNR